MLGLARGAETNVEATSGAELASAAVEVTAAPAASRLLWR